MSVCIITGGASGIGLECGKGFLKQNNENKLSIIDLIIPYQIESDLIKTFGQSRILFSQADVTDHSQVFAAFQETIKKFNKIDILFNNAGLGQKINTVSKDEQELLKNYKKVQKILDVNLTAVIKITLLGVMFMQQSKTAGHIINVSSMGGIIPQGDVPVYSASKHGVIGFTRSLSYLKKEQNIRINTLCPSFIETPLVLNALSKQTGKTVNPGELVKLGIAMHTDVVVKAFMQTINDSEINGEVITVVPGNQIKNKKYPSIIKLPGESQRGGSLLRIPSEEELKQFKQQMKMVKMQNSKITPKL